MKTILHFLIVLLFGVVCYSCSSDEPAVTPDPAPEENPQIPAISAEEAADIASRAILDFVSDPSRTPVTSSITFYPNYKRDTAFYVVDFVEGGYIAVNADPSSPVNILAAGTSETISYDGLRYLTTLHINGIAIPDPVLPIQPGINVSNEEKSYPTPSWGIFDPFNKYCISDDGQQSVVGAAALAVGEVLAYHKTPVEVDGVTFNWDTDINNLDAVARLLYYIGVEMGADYRKGKCVLANSKILNGLKDFGFSNAHCLTGIPSDPTSLLSSGPIIFAHDAGPVWVADGYKVTTTKEKSIVDIDGNWYYITTTDYYYHFNWGDEGVGNDYFWVATVDNGQKSQTTGWSQDGKFYSVGGLKFYVP